MENKQPIGADCVCDLGSEKHYHPQCEYLMENKDWREIDFAIMYFQVHVRKVTGGNDFGFVDSTDLKSAIKQTLNTSINQALAEERERVVAHIKELSGEMRTSETDKILSSLDKPLDKDEIYYLKKAGFTEATEEEISRATEVNGLIINPKE